MNTFRCVSRLFDAKVSCQLDSVNNASHHVALLCALYGLPISNVCVCASFRACVRTNKLIFSHQFNEYTK